MKNFRLLGKLFRQSECDAVLSQIEAHPELWDQNNERTTLPNSPHAQSSDIWLRFRARAELDTPAKFGEPHFAEFYPAWRELPAVQHMPFKIMTALGAVYLGGILLTRLPPGAEILPHVDTGWHPEFLNAKAYVILKANERCLNHCGDETVIMLPGEAWLFNNRVMHSVQNRGQTERIALIITMRVEI